MNTVDLEWQKLTKGGDTVERLKNAGLPCTGLRNYRPILSDGSQPTIERVRELLSSTKTALTTEREVAPTPRKRRRKQK